MKYKVTQNFGRADENLNEFVSKKKAISFAKGIFEYYIKQWRKYNKGTEYNLITNTLEYSNPKYLDINLSLRICHNNYIPFNINVRSYE